MVVVSAKIPRIVAITRLNRRDFIFQAASAALFPWGAFRLPLRDAGGNLQTAIDRCHAKGGGTVVVPAGTHPTGTVLLRSGVHLELQEGALLLGSTDLRDYPRQPLPAYRSLADGGQGMRALIYAEGAEDIGIFGKGGIDGQGAHFQAGGRPRLLQFVSCRRVRVEDVMLRNSAMWMQHYLNCDEVELRGLKVWNHANHNNDMLDIDGCRNVTVTGCVGDTDDDAITLKATGPASCENVTIRGCVVSSHCNAIKCGTETTGGFRSIAVADCAVKPSASPTKINGHLEGISGISLEIVDGGTMDGVTIDHVHIEGTMAPFFVRLGNRARPFLKGGPKPPVGALRNIRISNVIAKGAGNIGSSITGLPGHPVENVTMNRIHVALAAAGEAADVHRPVAERERSYPEVRMWGRLPAYGFYVRHAKHVHFEDVTMTPAAGEPRPAIVAEDVVDGRFPT